MEKVLEITTLGHLKEALQSMEAHIHMQIIHDYINLVAGLSGGCSCNRKARANDAKRMYNIIATSLTDDQKSSIKQVNSVDRVILKLDNKTINEF